MKTAYGSVLVSVALAMAVLAVGCDDTSKGSVEDKKQIVGAQEQAAVTPIEPTAAALADAECRVSLAVDGMVCNEGCPPVVKKTLQGVAGVSHVLVDFPRKHAEVLGDGAICTEPGSQGLVDALKTKNYGSTVERIDQLGS